MSNAIPASVMDAMGRAAANRVNLADRGEAMKWLVYHGGQEQARWLMHHPADYPAVLDALDYGPVAS